MTTTFVKYSRPLKYHLNRMLPVLTVDFFLSKSLTLSNSGWQNGKERPFQSTNNRDMTERAIRYVFREGVSQ